MRTFTCTYLLAYTQPSRITDYHNNEAFLLVKCIRRWAGNQYGLGLT